MGEIMRWLSIRALARACGLLALLATAAAFGSLMPASALAAGSAGYTTFNPAITDGGFTGGCVHGSEVNCNTYVSKADVYINGGPTGGNGLANGEYFFAVLAPGCQNGGFLEGANGNLSDETAGSEETGCSDAGEGGGDSVAQRTFTVTNGVISSYSGGHETGTAKNGNTIISLAPYDDTPNPGGVYILAICPVGATTAAPCKFDAFKVKAAGECTEDCSGQPLIVTKTANAGFERSYEWTISKNVDKTLVEQIGGTATFKYTVEASETGFKDGKWQATGTISVSNFNSASVQLSGITDVISSGGAADPNASCEVETGTDEGSPVATNGAVSAESVAEFPYKCTYSAAPASEEETNTVTAGWGEQTLSNGALLAEGSEAFEINFAFDNGNEGNPTTVDKEVTIKDSFAGELGKLLATDEEPFASGVYHYERTVTVPTFNCVEYTNTATIEPTGQTAEKTVKVCGPAKTGALTMGFWQNRNGQGIITGQAKTGTCPSATWLRKLNPFSDLGATSTCAQVATYVYNAIKAASCTSTTKTCNSMLKAQMLATALDVYFSDPALGGNKIGAAAPVGGVTIDLTKICAMIDGSGTSTCSGSFENVSSAFGGATSMTVLNMLLYQNTSDPLADGGAAWYKQEKPKQVLAKDAFDAINNQVAFAP
jgi:hypothetical protein